MLAEKIKELTANVTLDDIRKEVLLKQMPTEVRQQLNDRIDDVERSQQQQRRTQQQQQLQPR